MVVVLPAPLAPSRQKISPGSMLQAQGIQRDGAVVTLDRIDGFEHGN